MTSGSDPIDEGFLQRYRELLDAEDSAFDELEHAYEDGDRAHWDKDLASWRGIVERRLAFLERYGMAPIATL
jgi:hypothetical protein